MSLINGALKKADREMADDVTPEGVYPQKIFFLAGRQSHHRFLSLVLKALVLGGLVVAALKMLSVTQQLLRLGGVPTILVDKPRLLPVPAPARGRHAMSPTTKNAFKTLTESLARGSIS